MSHKKKVSIIIPVYQVEQYLERTIESVLAQTLSEKEIILVDDGSTDGSHRICDRYAEEYPGLIRVIHKENEGLGPARNTGIQAACGEYIAFLDSDDTVEPDMYERMYEKAAEDSCEIVMCDVKIIYVEEQRTVISECYPKTEIDPADYIANGNNITYSVNKLFQRKIWEERKYEKMLFEDIALIPSLMTIYTRIGYVKEPFYHYYRRANTISTTFSGQMVDIVEAYRLCIKRINPDYRDEAVYCIAKQLLWNMTRSRVVFQADFIEFLKEQKRYFLLNPYLEKDRQTKKILEFLDKEVIPENIICVHLEREIPEKYMEMLHINFPNACLIDVHEVTERDNLPDSVRDALSRGKLFYVEEYLGLKILSERGGIVLVPDMHAELNLKKLRLNRVFFGFEDDEELMTGCFGSVKDHYVIQALLDSYEEENIYNKALLPFRERLRDFLIVHFQLKVNGRNQFLRQEIQICLPSILAYDMKNGENCCKWERNVPEGYELVSEKVLRMWSDRLMENWNLYKAERSAKQTKDVKKAGLKTVSERTQEDFGNMEIEKRMREVAELYENSTSWKLTKPVRLLGALLKR